MSQGCTWLFGRGASIANGLPWVLPEEWKRDLGDGKVTRDQHIAMITEAMRQAMDSPSVDCNAYQHLLDTMARSTIDDGHHLLMTTNWDYLLQRKVDAWIEVSQPGVPRSCRVAPRFLGQGSMVYHFNGSTEPGDWQNRSPFILETDSRTFRRSTFEANKAFHLLLWSQLIVIVGMSFECDSDIGLLGALKEHEDNTSIGSALFVVVEPNSDTLRRTCSKLHTCFPRAAGMPIALGMSEWVDAGMPELTHKIFRPNGDDRLASSSMPASL